MEVATIAYIALITAVCALLLGLRVAFMRTSQDVNLEEFMALRRNVEQRYDEFIDHRDKSRTWMNREKTRAARETNEAAQPNGSMSAHQTEKERLRALDRLRRGA